MLFEAVASNVTWLAIDPSQNKGGYSCCPLSSNRYKFNIISLIAPLYAKFEYHV